MSQEYSRGILRVAVAQICQHLGWTSIHAMPLELLTDVLERYLLQLGKVTHRYSEQFGRTTPRLEDVSLAFSHMGVKLSELEDFTSHVDTVPFAKEVVAFPEPCAIDLKFPNPDSKEVQQRKVFEFVPEYLPYMHPELNEDLEEPQPAPIGSPERLQVDAQSQIGEMSPGQGEKRLLSSPGESGAPFKRPRLTTSQPLPEEAFHSQHEMTSVVMTNSGILSPLREGKLPDSKPPPTGFKQIVVVKPAAGVKLVTETPIIKLDFSQESDGPAKIVEIDKEGGSTKKTGVEKKDPDFNPKKKKKQSEVKRSKILKDIKLKKRGPGRPKSPGSAAVVHNKGAAAISKILAMSKKDINLSILNEDPENARDVPVEMPMKPTPPVPNISVHVDESARSKSDHPPQKATDYKPKTVTISKQQEKDMEDTIASVIERSSREMDIRLSEAVKKERSVSPHEKVKTEPKENEKDTWRVSHISETYIGDNDKDDSFENADDDTDSKDEKEKDADTNAYVPPGQYLAPHLLFLQQKSPKPRGRPRGSTKSSMYSSGVSRQQKGRKPGRPPLSQSPGRSVNRSPGRPPLSRSPGPGRPSLKRSPGRPPGSGRSPGRPKGSFSTTHSPKPRGRPRGSKSPRYRGMSPRGGSPRAVASLNFDEDVTAINSRILEDHSEASATKLFDFPDKSSDIDDYGKDRSPTPKLHSKDTPRSSSSPRKERTPDTRDLSPNSSSPTKFSLTVKREPTPDGSNILRESVYSSKRDSSVESDLVRKRDRDYDSYSEDRPSSRSDNWKEPVHIKEERSQSREKENRLFPSFKDRSKEREMSMEKEPLFKERDNSSERESSVYSHEREFSREREHKDHSRERDHHSKDRDRDRSKEHRKDKKKKKKKDKDKDREREKDRDRDRKEKHKKEKEPKEEEPSVKPLQKLTIKFGGGSTPSTGFSISKTQHSSSPLKPEPVSSPPRPEIPKLKFKVLPPKPDSGSTKAEPSCQSWKSTIKTEKKRTPSPKPETVFPRHVSPKPEPDVETNKASGIEGKGDGGKEEEVTVSLAVVGGKIMGQKPVKRKRKGSKGKGRAKTEIKKPFITPVSVDENDEDTQPAMESDPDKDPLSPFQTNQNVPSPITIPALKAAPPPPSPPTNKKSPPKSKTFSKEPIPQSPLFKDIGKTKPPKPPPVQIPKATKGSKSPRRSSPRKSPKISPPVKKKPTVFSQPSPTKTTPPPSKSSSFSDSQPPRSPSMSYISSPSFSPPASPMYSPASSPARDSPLHFMIPPTPAFPTRTASPAPSPPSRQLSTDDEKEATPPVDRPEMPPPLPPMPPSASQKKAQRTVVAETVGSFVNECGEKIWICPACTMQDDGSPMIGCDLCDDWYHWVCVNIVEEPSETESWYCPKCVKPTKSKGKRGRKKKKP